MNCRLLLWILLTVELHVSLVIPHSWTWQDAPIVIGNSQSNKCVFGEKECAIQCAGRKYDKWACKKQLCHCVRRSVSVFTATPVLCEKKCGLRCKRKMPSAKSVCDNKGNCLCYEKDDALTVRKGKCIVPSTYCLIQCKAKYDTEDSSCEDELCFCAKGLETGDRRVRIMDFTSEFCPIPKIYCSYRCKRAKFKTGVCQSNRCVCANSQYGSAEDYFSFDVSIDDDNCEECKEHCNQMPHGKGRCIANQCVCMSLDNFDVPLISEPHSDCEIPTDYCIKLCAQRHYHENAVCQARFVCLCASEGKRMAKIDFLKGKCKNNLKNCTQHCSVKAGDGINGFCNGGDCLCAERSLLVSQPKAKVPAFICQKVVPKPFETLCRVL